jgi:hypothetical protein
MFHSKVQLLTVFLNLLIPLTDSHKNMKNQVAEETALFNPKTIKMTQVPSTVVILSEN